MAGKTVQESYHSPYQQSSFALNALPLELQARNLLKFGESPPDTHPYPRPLESLFDGVVQFQVLTTN
jgi:hypothetical protein